MDGNIEVLDDRVLRHSVVVDAIQEVGIGNLKKKARLRMFSDCYFDASRFRPRAVRFLRKKSKPQPHQRQPIDLSQKTSRTIQTPSGRKIIIS